MPVAELIPCYSVSESHSLMLEYDLCSYQYRVKLKSMRFSTLQDQQAGDLFHMWSLCKLERSCCFFLTSFIYII